MQYKLTLVLLLLSGLLFGQTDSLHTVELSDVVISANRIQTPFSESARSISVITRQQIEQSPAQSVNELLSYVVGVDVRQRGPAGVQADVSLRGGTFEQTLVLINGVKVSDPQTGHHQMNLPVDMSAIERIEVLKGPAARIYGQNAFAGAINIVTKVPEEPTVNGGLYGGDFETFGGNIGWSLPGERYGQMVTVAHDQSAGYRPNADYNITNAFYQSYLKAGSGQFNLMAGHTLRNFGAGGFYVPESQEYEEVRTTLASVDYQGSTRRWTYQPRVYWRRNHDDYRFLRDSPKVYNNLHTTHTAGAELNTTYRNNAGLTGLGAEVRHERIDSNGIRTLRDTAGVITDTVTVSFLGQRHRTIVGFFAEHRFYLFDRLDVTPGVYVNWFSDYGWNYFPGIDASWDVGQGWRVFGNVGRSFRIPTYTDLYYEGPTNVGNSELEPEDAISYEIGTKYFRKNLRGQISYFQRDASQLIDWVRAAGAEEGTPWQPRNFYDVAVKGVEVSTQWNPNTDWISRVSLDYTYIDADLAAVEAVESRYAIQNLKHQLIFAIDHRIWQNFYHQLRVRYADRASQLDSYALVDSRILYQNQQYNVYVEATNLTDTEYTETGFVTMPGRWLRAGINVTFGY